MPDPEYFKSSLTAQEIENVLNGIRSVTGIIKRTGESSYEAAAPGTDFAVSTLIRNSNPTTSTEGVVGQFCFNTTNQKIFICSSVSGSNYTWNEISSENVVTDPNNDGNIIFSKEA